MMLLWHCDAITGDNPDKLTPEQVGGDGGSEASAKRLACP
jgi:hypothetical protein